MTLMIALSLLVGCGGVGDGAVLGEVWADNWSSMYIDGELVMEDSVSIDTERSFNAETFSFDAEVPFVVAVVLKDFKENDSGLEYIGESNQQMGDGGYIAQLTDQDSGEILAVSSSAWRCLVIHEAPLDTSCEGSADPLTDCGFAATDEPAGWADADYDDSGWDGATEYSKSEVSPKEGYDEISWDDSAALIWTGDLETDNTLLCRVTVE
jgi:hypothetical protein